MTNKPKETCNLGSDVHSCRYSKMKSDESNYIHEHLETLNLITQLTRPNNILEIGTGDGYSTVAFAEGCACNGKGRVTTLDINECKLAKAFVKESDLENWVTFIQESSTKLKLTASIDILFIDGLHTYEQVKEEIERFKDSINDEGFMIFHDAYNPAHPGVMKAIQEFLMKNIGKWNMFEWYNCNGLVVLRKDEE